MTWNRQKITQQRLNVTKRGRKCPKTESKVKREWEQRTKDTWIVRKETGKDHKDTENGQKETVSDHKETENKPERGRKLTKETWMNQKQCHQWVHIETTACCRHVTRTWRSSSDMMMILSVHYEADDAACWPWGTLAQRNAVVEITLTSKHVNSRISRFSKHSQTWPSVKLHIF